MGQAGEIVHEVKSGVMGATVLYECPQCGSPLTSSLDESGSQDACPDCGAVFIVPGSQARQQADIVRKNTDAIRLAEQEERLKSRADAVVRRAARRSSRDKDLQLDRDPLKEWCIYALVILLLLAIFGGRYMFQAVTSDSSGITIVILGIFLIGIGINLAGIVRLRNEYVCAAMCIAELKASAGLAKLVSLDPAGIFHRHLKDLVHIAKYDSNVSQDSLVTLLYSRMMAKSKMVDILAGVLVSLGLIGTIVGLISMTDGLSASLESISDGGDTGGLMSGMRATMGGLGTAFYTTLIGAMLGSVVLRVLNNVYTSNVDHLVSYVASTAEVTIVPQLKRAARTKGKTSDAVLK